MGRRTWIKIFCDNWLRGTIREETPSIRGVWVDLLTLAGDSAYGDIGKISLAKRCGLSDEQICVVLNIDKELWKKAKKRLLKTERIRVNGYNEIKILNWKKYQSEYERTKEAQSRYRKSTTKSTPKTIREKEKEKEKEIKKEKENIKKYKYMNSEFVKLTPEEFKKLKAKYGEHITKLCIEKLDNYIGSTGKRYKSHYRTILNWVADEVMKANPMSRGSKGGIPKVVKEMEAEGWKHE